MSNIVDRLGNLITVKSLVTLALTIVFAVLSIRGNISSELFVTIFSTIIGYYFGTQKIDDTKNNKEQWYINLVNRVNNSFTYTFFHFCPPRQECTSYVVCALY